MVTICHPNLPYRVVRTTWRQRSIYVILSTLEERWDRYAIRNKQEMGKGESRNQSGLMSKRQIRKRKVRKEAERIKKNLAVGSDQRGPSSPASNSYSG